MPTLTRQEAGELATCRMRLRAREGKAGYADNAAALRKRIAELVVKSLEPDEAGQAPLPFEKHEEDHADA